MKEIYIFLRGNKSVVYYYDLEKDYNENDNRYIRSI